MEAANANGKRAISLEHGFVQVPLRGRLDLAGLTEGLKRDGYYLSDDPDETDSQGWGHDLDREGYYPYQVFRDGEEWVFAFAAEDYRQDGEGNHPVVGEKARQEIRRWLPYLEGFTQH